MTKKNERGNAALALKSGFWYVASTFITKGLAFITTPIFARLMTTGDYGEFTNFANWQSLLIIVISGELYNTLARAYYDFKTDFDEYASTTTVMGFFLTLVFYVFFLVSKGWIFDLVAIPPEFVHLMFFTILFQSIRQIYLAKERTLYRYKSVAVISVLTMVIPTVISILIVYKVPETRRLAARMYGFYVPYALIGVYCAAALLRKGIRIRKEHVRFALVLAAPLLVHYLTTYVLSSTNTIITKSVLGAEAAAVVSIAVSITNILTMLFQAVTGAMTTYMMDNLELKRHDKVRRCITLFAVSGAVISAGIILLGPEAVMLIGGRKYTDAISLVPGSIVAVFLQILTSALAIILTYDKNVVKTAVATGAIAAVSVGVKILLLRRLGYGVLPIVNVAAFALTMIINYLVVRRAGYADCIDKKNILVIIVGVLAVYAAAGFLYRHTALRYGLILAALIAVTVGLVMTGKKWMPFIVKRFKKNKTN